MRALRAGHLDGLVIGEPGSERVVTLTSIGLPYRVIVDHLGDGAMVLDRSGTILFANARFCELFGRPGDDVIGRAASDLLGDAATAIVGVEVARTASVTYDLPSAAPDEHGRHVLIVARGAIERGSEIVCCVVTDVSRERALENELVEHRRQRAVDDLRLATARDVNDTIVQGLVAVEIAIDLGDAERARRHLAETSAFARRLIGDLVGDQPLSDGSARRGTRADLSAPGAEARR